MPVTLGTTTLATSEMLGTAVRNISGQTMFFSYLGRHGKTLAPNELYIHHGDLFEWLASYRRGGRQIKFFEYALNIGWLSIERTPAVVLYDYVLSHPRQLELANSILGFSDPLSAPSPNSAFVNA